MKKRICSIALAIVMAICLVVPVQAKAATEYEGWEVADDNGVICVGMFNELTYGYLVFYPESMQDNDEVYPLISWANGTACAPGMYYELLSEIAAGGYIVVTNTDVMAADGSSQIDSIDFMISENSDSESIFYNRIDVENIGAAGHSQGGRSAVNAAVADSRIKCVMSIAGSNYSSEAAQLSTPTFFTTGTRDMVVMSSMWVKPAYNNCTGTAVYASLNKGIHTTCCLSPEKYSGYAIEWFNAYLKNDAECRNTFKAGGKLSKDSNWKDYMSKGF